MGLGFFKLFFDHLLGRIDTDNNPLSIPYQNKAFFDYHKIACLLKIYQVITISDIIYLAVDDYLELYTYQNSGGNQTVENGEAKTYLSIHRLS